jgi:hypothetical protein
LVEVDDGVPVIAPGTGPALEDPVDLELRLLAQATGEGVPFELVERVLALRATHGVPGGWTA